MAIGTGYVPRLDNLDGVSGFTSRRNALHPNFLQAFSFLNQRSNLGATICFS
jgi:hypothetical protein